MALNPKHLTNFRWGREKPVGTAVPVTSRVTHVKAFAPLPLSPEGWTPEHDGEAFMILATAFGELLDDPEFALIQQKGCDCTHYESCRFCGNYSVVAPDGVWVRYGASRFQEWLHGPRCPAVIVARVRDYQGRTAHA